MSGPTNRVHLPCATISTRVGESPRSFSCSAVTFKDIDSPRQAEAWLRTTALEEGTAPENPTGADLGPALLRPICIDKRGRHGRDGLVGDCGVVARQCAGDGGGVEH